MKKTRLNKFINNFLESNRKKKPISFHMPGHKYGRFPYDEIFFKYSDYDITEIPGADNIKHPEGIIKLSMERTAGIYGSRSAFYLTNGSTSGIHAILRYAAMAGGKIIMSRDSHLSALNGAIMFKVDTAFIPMGNTGDIPLPVSIEVVEDVIEENPDACGILITSPNYYGKTADICQIADIAHKNNMFLAVDEAHGAHFKFSGMGHLSGIENGADIVCHSLHKTLPVYNPGAVLHICSDIIDIARIKEAVGMLGSTSPSYPLLASMEKAIFYYSENGAGIYRKLEYQIMEFCDKLESRTGCIVIKTDDFTRIVIRTEKDGYEVLKILHEKYNIDLESADFNHIVAIATPCSRPEDFTKLLNALAEVSGPGDNRENPGFPDLPKKKIEMHKAYSDAHLNTPVDIAEGCICGTIIVSFPPGTPLICPGEIIDGSTVEYINRTISLGGTILGVENNRIPVLE